MGGIIYFRVDSASNGAKPSPPTSPNKNKNQSPKQLIIFPYHNNAPLAPANLLHPRPTKRIHTAGIPEKHQISIHQQTSESPPPPKRTTNRKLRLITLPGRKRLCKLGAQPARHQPGPPPVDPLSPHPNGERQNNVKNNKKNTS